MSEPTLGTPGPPQRVPDLLDGYRQQQDAHNSRARELVRLRSEVLAAAETEAASLVKETRAHIARLLSDARRELVGLAAQVDAIPEAPGGSASTDTAATRSQVLDARRELRRVVQDARADLDGLRVDARLPRSSRRRPRRTPIADVEETIVQAAPPQSPGLWGWVMAAAAAALVLVVGGYATWIRGVPPSQRTRTQATPLAAGTATAAPGKSLPAVSSGGGSPSGAQPSSVALLIETDRPSWIRTTIDGRADAGRVFAAGEKKTVRADREIVLRAGDAGAVFVTMNGGERKPIGPRGVVATRRFAVEPAPVPSTPRGAAAPLPAPSAAVPVGRTTAPIAPPAPSRREDPSSNDGAVLTGAAERWLDAYYRQDTPALTSIATRDMKVSDERAADERLPPGLPAVSRTLDGVTLQFVGENAVLSGKLIEHAAVDNQPVQRVAWISQMWIREGAVWRLMNVHILSDAKLKPSAQKR
jgi:hypothetical protein